MHRGVEYLVTTLTVCLGSTQREGGVSQELVGLVVALRAHRDPETCRDKDLFAVDDERGRQQIAHPIGDTGSACFVTDVLSQNDELVSTQPREGIGGSKACVEAPRYRHQELVTKSVTMLSLIT